MICHLVWMKYKVLIFFVSVSIRQAIDCRRSELVTYISCCCLLAYRSSHPEVFCKKGILRNFAKFTGKNLSQSLFFNKVAGLRPATLFKKRLWHRCFPVNFVKFLRTPFLTEHLRWLFLSIVSLMNRILMDSCNSARLTLTQFDKLITTVLLPFYKILSLVYWLKFSLKARLQNLKV